MIAVDTNVIVRLLVGDDQKQAGRARLLFEQRPIAISATVLLETEWVLRSAYEFAPYAIFESFMKLCGLPRVTLIQPGLVRTALEGYRIGLDFADALHLAGAIPASQFATFDRALVRAAAKLSGAIEVVEP